MIRIVIADDEPLARRALRELIGREDDLELTGEAATGGEALRLLRQQSPDLAILDIRMPGPSGLEILESLDDPPLVIFATAFDGHAVTAFELQALDYLLKPFSGRRFAASMDRARAALASGRVDSSRTAEALGGRPRHIVVRERGVIRPIPVADVLCFTGSDDYVELHLEARSHLASVRMKHLATHLDPDLFVRVHRSVIVNLRKVAEVVPETGGRAEIVLTDGRRVPASRSGWRRLRAVLKRA